MGQDRWTANTISCSVWELHMIDSPGGSAIVCREYLKEVSRCMIQAAFDISVEDPFWGARRLPEHIEALFEGIMCGSALTEPVGIGVRRGLRHRVECEQM